VLKWSGTAWVPSGDNDAGGDITGVTAGAGLTGGGISGSVSVSLSSVGAAAGETLKWTGAAFDWLPDNNNTYTAGQALQLSGSTFSVAQQGATAGQVLAWSGSGWTPVPPRPATLLKSSPGPG
jgi:hypothetical protein